MACNLDMENGDVVVNANSEIVRDKRRGTLGCILRLKRRISHRFTRMLVSREDIIIPSSDQTNQNVSVTMVIRNGFSQEFMESVNNEPNGNILTSSSIVSNNSSSSSTDTIVDNGNKPIKYNLNSTQHKVDNCDETRRSPNKISKPRLVRRQWSDTDGPPHEGHSKVVSNQNLIQIRQRKPPRPKSECLLLDGASADPTTKSHRFSAFRGTSPFGKTDTYVKLDQLGEGSYATVYKGISNLNNKLVALKEIRLLEEEGTPFTAIREASLLKDLRHANVVTLHDIIHTKVTLTFVFEFVNTDLSQYLEKHGGGGLCPQNVKVLEQTKWQLEDLKPQNLLISEIGELKLADFGLARAKSVPSRTYSNEVVTLWYRPPDVLLGSTDYSSSLDMWGVGCIFIEMITGVATFPGIKDSSDQLDKIWKILGTPTEETWEGVSRYPHFKTAKFGRYKGQGLASAFPKLQDIQNAECLASQMLQVQPQRRLLAKSAIRHKYFSDLPSKIYDLPDQVSIYNVPGCKYMPELHNQPLSVIRAAAKLRERM